MGGGARPPGPYGCVICARWVVAVLHLACSAWERFPCRAGQTTFVQKKKSSLLLLYLTQIASVLSSIDFISSLKFSSYYSPILPSIPSSLSQSFLSFILFNLSRLHSFDSSTGSRSDRISTLLAKIPTLAAVVTEPLLSLPKYRLAAELLCLALAGLLGLTR